MNQCDEIPLNESEQVCKILLDVYQEFIILSTSFCQHGEGRTYNLSCSLPAGYNSSSLLSASFLSRSPSYTCPLRDTCGEREGWVALDLCSPRLMVIC